MSSGRRLRRVATFALLALILVTAAGFLWARGKLRASLPVLDGKIAIAGLERPVTVTRDGAGVVTIRADSRVDAARGLGFVHGQDRFFQMDLARRFAAGELAELLGPGPVDLDKKLRLHRFRARAARSLAALTSSERALIEAYTAGVNAGLDALAGPSFEYLLLGSPPRPWAAEDLALVIFSMYLDLNDGFGERESTRGVVEDVLGAEMLAFLDPLGTPWDAPILGEALPVPPTPGPEVLDLRNVESRDGGTEAVDPEPTTLVRGSNNWAVAGGLTRDGRALLANDMHLGHQVPNIWYRAVLEFPDRGAPGGLRRIAGVTLPGTPFVIAGSNGEVAWGFTNTWGDWEDLVEIEPDPDAPEHRYRTPEGLREFELHEEEIRVRDAEPERMVVRETLWGPVLDVDHQGRERAYRWIAHDPEGMNLGALELERASSVDEAIVIANRIGAPPQNFVVVDASGRIGWTVMGAIPRRHGHDGRTPTSWADGGAGWDGYYPPEEYPRVLDPEEGMLWSANARLVDGEMMRRIGVGTFRLGARQQQIRDALRALERYDERSLLSVQLDDRALFLEPWRRLLAAHLTDSDRGAADEGAADERTGKAALRAALEDWDGRASTASAAYRLVRAFRIYFAEEVLGAVVAEAKRADPRLEPTYLIQQEGALWRLVTERPEHFLHPDHASWESVIDAAVGRTVAYFSELGPLAEQTWGRRNAATIRHPMSRFLPSFVGRWLDMPADELPGDENMPRFQGPSEGASERFVVSPGREEEGIFHMPTGQSGHPLSPFYRAGHEAWVRGEPTPFLPQEPAHTLELVPGGGGP